MKELRILAAVLLIFNGVSAIVGGAVLFIDPTGRSIRIPLSILEHSPFDNFFVPGILLFVLNGILSLLIAILVIRNYRNRYFLILLQGIVSITWIVTQVIMIRAAVWLHYLYGGIGLALLLSGAMLLKSTKHHLK